VQKTVTGGACFSGFHGAIDILVPWNQERQAAPVTVFSAQLGLLHLYYPLRSFWQLCYMQKMFGNCFVQLYAP